MQISFADKKLENVYQDQRLLIKIHGPIRAKKINQRLALLRAAETLADIRNFPGRCHELKGDRAGQLALDLDHPYRLILRTRPLPRAAQS